MFLVPIKYPINHLEFNERQCVALTVEGMPIAFASTIGAGVGVGILLPQSNCYVGLIPSILIYKKNLVILYCLIISI